MLIGTHLLPTADAGNMPTYCGMDSCVTYEIDDALERHPRAKDSELIYNLECAMQGPALEMMQRGFKVDWDARHSAMMVAEMKLEATKKVLNTLSQAVMDNDINFASRNQLKNLFYNHMGIRPLRAFVKGEEAYPMDRKILERIEEGYFLTRPIVNSVLLARDLTKTLQILKTEIDDDWRWRCSYNIGGTKTGRWSSSSSIEGSGGNFQNITEELRRIFIADDGWMLCGIDLEQAEAREVGWFCGIIFGDWSYLDACESGDLHTYVTRLVYPEWAWTGNLKADRKLAERKFYRHFTYRDANKRVGHASNYVGKPYTISTNTKIPMPLITQFQERYFDAFPCIPRMHHWVAKELQTKQYLVNAFGRRRDFFDRPDSDETLRSGVAYLFQSATGDRLNLGLLRTWAHMGTRIQMLAQLHDAQYFQFRITDNVEEIIREAQEHMNIPLFDPKSGRKFTIPSEPLTGFNWAHRWKLDADGNPVEWNKWGLDKPGAKR